MHKSMIFLLGHIENAKYLNRDKIPRSQLGKIETALQLFEALEDNGIFSLQNVESLEGILKDVHCYGKKVQEKLESLKQIQNAVEKGVLF